MSILRFLLVVMVLIASRVAHADDVAGVLRDWDQRRGAVRTVRYVIKWEEFPIRQLPGELKPGTDGLYTGTSQLLIDFEKGRYRYERDGLSPSAVRGQIARHVRTHRYDGRQEYTALEGVPLSAVRPAEPMSANIGPWSSGFTDSREVAPPLWGHGIHWTNNDHSGHRFPLLLIRQPHRYTLSRREEVEGRSYVVLRDTAAQPSTIHTLRCDPARGGAVVRERIEGANHVSESTLSYRETPLGWFAEQWAFHHGAPGEPLRESSRYRVEKFELNPSVTDDDFRIVLRTGMGVSMEGREYRADADGTLTPIAPKNSERDPFGQFDDQTKGIGIALLVLVLLLVGLFLWLRHRRIKQGIEWT